MPFAELSELKMIHDGSGVRIPPDKTVPLTPRVRRLLDSSPLRRLASVRQLGLVSLVYPGAVHSRLEHSLGVYQLALAFLASLHGDKRFRETISEQDAAAFLVAAILHDIGHWPYCHPIEDMDLPDMPRHEERTSQLISTDEITKLLSSDWGLQPERIAQLILGTASDPPGKVVYLLLSGPIDVDKMDYLMRDSLHAGVPYGRHFDQDRLLASLCLNANGESLAITEKGRTAAELMVFARYVMFSEVYWHHAVRSATAMLQRTVWLSRKRLDTDLLVQSTEDTFVKRISDAAKNSDAQSILEGLFGPRRKLFKRIAAFDAKTHPVLHNTLAGLSYKNLVHVSNGFVQRLAKKTGTIIKPNDILIDAPPREREIEFNLQVCCRGQLNERELHWRSLVEMSPVTQSLAQLQFDHLVKQVRIFGSDEAVSAIQYATGLEDILLEASNDVCS
ncbi:MAG: HD domain-containing protein [Pirellulales bacterium]